jgi:DNA-binding MarR family transcriptional regulator
MKRAALKLEKPLDLATESAPELTGTLHFMQLLWELHHNLQARSKSMESTHGVTGPQRLVLRLVGRFPELSAGELADVLHLHPSTLTGILRRLEEHGLLQRKPDPNDGRRALLKLTSAGKRIDSKRSGTVEAAVRQALARLDDSDRDAAERAIGYLIETLGSAD